MHSRIKVITGKAIFVIVVTIISSLLLFRSQLAPKSSPDFNPPSPESIVTFPNHDAKETFLRHNDVHEKDLQPTQPGSTTYIAPIPSNKEPGEEEGDIFIAPRRQYRALLTPNDPIYPQAYTTTISAPAAWDITTGNSTVTIAIIDTGFALNHEDMVNRWHVNSSEFGNGKETNGLDDDENGKVDDWRGWDFIQQDNDPSVGSTNPASSTASHGSVTAGLIGATGNNGAGVASINWGANILPLQVLSDEGLGYTEDIVNAIDYAVAQGAKVVSMSLGTNYHDPTLQAAITNAVNAGVTVVAAAGNCGDPNNYQANGCDILGQVVYPAKYNNVIAVGASTSSDTRASFSSYGPEVDVLAPGSGAIRSPTWSPSNQTTRYTTSAAGTSIATPIIAGASGLLHSTVPNLTPAEVTTILKYGVTKVAEMKGANKTDQHGYGRLNAWRALKFTTLPHPDGMLIKSADNPNVYLLENGQRRLIGSPAVFHSQGYAGNKIWLSTLADARLATGPNVFFREGTLLRGNEPPIYVVDYQDGTIRKRHITSIEAFQGLGFTETDITNVSSRELPVANGPAISNASLHPDGSLIRANGSLDVYRIESEQRRYIGSPEVLQSHNFPISSIKVATAGDNAMARAADEYFREGTLVKDANPPVYVIDNNSGIFQKRHITSSQIFTLLISSSVADETFTVPSNALPAQTGTPIQ